MSLMTVGYGGSRAALIVDEASELCLLLTVQSLSFVTPFSTSYVFHRCLVKKVPAVRLSQLRSSRQDLTYDPQAQPQRR
jgi:hypothetical protein